MVFVFFASIRFCTQKKDALDLGTPHLFYLLLESWITYLQKKLNLFQNSSENIFHLVSTLILNKRQNNRNKFSRHTRI